MSRIDPGLLAKVVITSPFAEEIWFAEDHATPAIGILPIVVEDCSIIDPTTVGFTEPYSVRRITGLPFNIVGEREINMWGTILDFTMLPAPVLALGISFSSQGKGKGILSISVS